jgi:hypothetical protein
MPIVEVRGLADGTTVTIEGVLTTALGALESGHGGFVQDPSGGIALYLDGPVVGAWPAGTTVTVEGVVSSRYGQRTLRMAETSAVPGPAAELPAASVLATGAAGESMEGRRVVASGAVSAAPDPLADGLAITIDEGSGPIRAILGPEALAGRSIVVGMLATVAGPLGQRDSSGTGVAGYRIHATLAGELDLVTPVPTPTPTPPPTASPTPTPAPTAAPTGSPAPTPTRRRPPLRQRHPRRPRRPSPSAPSGRSRSEPGSGRPAWSSRRLAAWGPRRSSRSVTRTPDS